MSLEKDLIVELYKNYKSIMVLSDLQLPYIHPKGFQFLRKKKKELKPDLVIQIGDFADLGPLSNYDSDPSGLSARCELVEVQKQSKILAKLFPKMLITMGNHDERLYKKALKGGIPESLLKNYNEIVGGGEGWQFCREVRLNWKKEPSSRIKFVHTGQGEGAAKPNLAVQANANVVVGHTHTNFYIKYASKPDGLLWQMNVGCLINNKSAAFAYAKYNFLRPVIGIGHIYNGKPSLHPMPL